MSERLQKALARLGYGSRRMLEREIEQGRVQIGHKVAKLGDKVDEGDTVVYRSKRIKISSDSQQSTRIILYFKPDGEVCTRRDEKNRKTVFDNLPNVGKEGRWINIGRLDLNTSGALLFTNNGELAHRLMHPKYEIEREYAVRILGEVSEEQLQQLRDGVVLDDGVAKFDRIYDSGGEGANHWYHVVLKEGRNREVRRMWESIGLTVSRLIRIRFANVELGRTLKKGKTRDLTVNEVENLAKLVGLDCQDWVQRRRIKDRIGRLGANSKVARSLYKRKK